MERTICNAPCELTKRKYSGYFLKPGAKHADEFFAVGYAQDDVRLLRYDMASLFDAGKAINREIDEQSVETFNIVMLLGVNKKRPFMTAWQIDKPGDKPRIITSFRVSADDKRV